MPSPRFLSRGSIPLLAIAWTLMVTEEAVTAARSAAAEAPQGSEEPDPRVAPDAPVARQQGPTDSSQAAPRSSAVSPGRPSASNEAGRPSRAPSSRSTDTSRAASQRSGRSYQRLARAPDMFGDFYFSALAFTAFDDAVMELPVAGGSRRVKVCEHNKALPGNRRYFIYNHFHNALDFARFPPGSPVPAVTDSLHVDRFTFGLERTFWCGCWSAELRMPFTGSIDYVSASPGAAAPDFMVEGGSVGDLSIILKRLLYRDHVTAISAGLGISTPTGSDVRGTMPALSTSFVVRNEAVHLLPFVGLLSVSGGRFFCHGFAQLDIAANGNRIDVVDTATPATDSGVLSDQTLLYLDAGMGYWHWRNPCAYRIRGVASVVELHYTTTLQDTDRFAAFGGFPVFENLANRVDVVNLTAGVHTELSNGMQLRVGGVFPLDAGDDRYFDAELSVSLIGRFQARSRRVSPAGQYNPL